MKNPMAPNTQNTPLLDHDIEVAVSESRASSSPTTSRSSSTGGWRSASYLIGKFDIIFWIHIFLFFLFTVVESGLKWITLSVANLKNSRLSNLSYCYVYSILTFWLVCFSGGICGEVRILWGQLEPDNISEWAVGAVDGDGGGERKHVVRSGFFTSSAGCCCGWFLSWTLPYYLDFYSALHLGLFIPVNFS